MKTRVSFKYFVNDCPWKHFLASNSVQPPSNLISLSVLVLKGLSDSFTLNLEQLSCKNVLKFALLGYCFCDLSTGVKFGIKRLSSLF